MNTERTEKFVNALACDLEEGGFRQVSGTTLRRTLATAVSAALPLLEAGNPVSSPAGQGDDLLPCPFCGNNAEFVPYKNNGLTVKCKSMGCIQRHQRTLRYGIEWLRASMTEHWNARALAARQPGVPNGKLVGWWNGITPGYDGQGDWSIRWGADAENSRHDIPLYDGFNPIHYQQPAQGIDLGQFRALAQGWIDHAAHGPRDDALAAYDQCGGELLALIGQRDAAPGVGQ